MMSFTYGGLGCLNLLLLDTTTLGLQHDNQQCDMQAKQHDRLHTSEPVLPTRVAVEHLYSRALEQQWES